MKGLHLLTLFHKCLEALVDGSDFARVLLLQSLSHRLGIEKLSLQVVMELVNFKLK
jgi:hypothetical protein